MVIHPQEAGYLQRKPNGKHIFEDRQVHDLEEGHPELAVLTAVFSYFGYWLAAPKSKLYQGTYPNQYRAARVEPVLDANGRTTKLIGYGNDVNAGIGMRTLWLYLINAQNQNQKNSGL